MEVAAVLKRAPVVVVVVEALTDVDFAAAEASADVAAEVDAATAELRPPPMLRMPPMFPPPRLKPPPPPKPFASADSVEVTRVAVPSAATAARASTALRILLNMVSLQGSFEWVDWVVRLLSQCLAKPVHGSVEDF